MAQAEKRKNKNNTNHDKQKSFTRYKGAIPPKSNITNNIKTVTYKVGYRQPHNEPTILAIFFRFHFIITNTPQEAGAVLQ